MAGFYLISCGDPAARARRAETAALHLSPIPCPIHTESLGKNQVVFALPSHAPFSRHESADGTLTLLLGRAIGEGGAVPAAGIARYREKGKLPCLSGLYVWLELAADGSFTAGGDPFSLLPVFHRCGRGMVEISSSQKAIRAGEDFVTEMDPVGISRYLIGHGSSGERTLDRGIQRLLDNHRLEVSAEGVIRIHKGEGFSAEGASPPATFEAACEEANHLIASAISRHSDTSTGRADLLCSGGLDSRLLLAHLTAQGISPRCLTRGLPQDDEVIYARKASRRAGCRWQLVPDDFGRALMAARAEVDLLSLSSGFSGIFYMLDVLDPAPRAAQTYNGFFLDAVLHPFNGIPDAENLPTFEAEFRRKMNAFGIAPQKLKSLFHHSDDQDAVGTALAEMEMEWNGLSEDPRVRYRQMLHRFRTNHHLGGILWKTAFASWPVFVALDIPLLRRLMDFPPDFFRDRRLERAMLIRLNPALAKIPLDGNSLRPKPLIANLGARLDLKARQLRERFFPPTIRHDPRRYHRILNMNGEAWSEIRRETDALRGHLETLFDRKALKAYFPRPRHPVPTETGDAISNHAGRRMLAGLAIYLEQTGQR
jgi:hypothetical protein